MRRYVSVSPTAFGGLVDRSAFEAEPPHVRAKRTRFHVNTALSLHANYKKTKGLGAKKVWKEEQQKIWLAKEEVRVSAQLKLYARSRLNPFNQHASSCEGYFSAVRAKEVQRDNLLRDKRREQ
jgi:hypothetical protein